jgi:hypothetical protein
MAVDAKNPIPSHLKRLEVTSGPLLLNRADRQRFCGFVKQLLPELGCARNMLRQVAVAPLNEIEAFRSM